MEHKTLNSFLNVILMVLLPKGFMNSKDLDTVVRRFVSLVQGHGKENSLIKCLSDINQTALTSYSEALINIDPLELSKDLDDKNFLLLPFVKQFSHYVLEVYYQESSTLASLGILGSPPFPGGQKMKQFDPSILEPMREWKPRYNQ